MREKKALPEIDLSAVLRIVNGRTRDLWEQLSGRAEHQFQLGARGCQLANGLWLLNVDGNRYYSVAIEADGELYQVGEAHTASPQIVAIVDKMTVFESHDQIAKAHREKLLAEHGFEEMELGMRKHIWKQDVWTKPGEGFQSKFEQSAPKSAAPNSMDDLLTTA